MERFGDYILLEKAASGGMADIYKAVKVGARGFFKLLAVKRIRPHICEDVTFQDMFVREAHVLSNLHGTTGGADEPRRGSGDRAGR